MHAHQGAPIATSRSTREGHGPECSQNLRALTHRSSRCFAARVRSARDAEAYPPGHGGERRGLRTRHSRGPSGPATAAARPQSTGPGRGATLLGIDVRAGVRQAATRRGGSSRRHTKPPRPPLMSALSSRASAARTRPSRSPQRRSRGRPARLSLLARYDTLVRVTRHLLRPGLAVAEVEGVGGIPNDDGGRQAGPRGRMRNQSGRPSRRWRNRQQAAGVADLCDSHDEYQAYRERF